MSKVKCKSHAERMAEPSVDYDLHLLDSYVERGTEDEVKEGIILKKAVYKTVSPKGKFEGSKASDFALENIIAAGAVGMLKDAQLSYGTLGAADSVEGSMENLSNAIASENNEQNAEQ